MKVPRSHRIKPAKGTAGFPTDLITVHVTCTCPDAAGTYDCVITGISAKGVYLGPGDDVEKLSTFEGTDPEAFLDWMVTRLRRDYTLKIIMPMAEHMMAHLTLERWAIEDGWSADRWRVGPRICYISLHRMGRQGEPGFDHPVTKDEKKNQFRIEIDDIRQYSPGVSPESLIEEFQTDVPTAMIKAMRSLWDDIAAYDMGFVERTASAQGWSLFLNKFLAPKLEASGKWEHRPDKYHPERVRKTYKQDAKVVREPGWEIWTTDIPRVVTLEAQAARMGPIVEAYVTGPIPGRAAQLDINGAYLNIQKTCKLPTKCIDFELDEQELANLSPTDDPRDFLKKRLAEDFLVIADVEVAHEAQHGWVPHIVDNRTFYGSGHFRTVLTTPELKLAFEQGLITRVHEASVYIGEKFLAPYAEFIEDRKDDTSGFLKGFYKLVGNSPHGKWAQEYEVWTDPDEELLAFIEESREMGEVLTSIEWDGVHYDIGCFMGKVQISEGVQYTDHTFKAISAHIMAYNRVNLRQIQEVCHRDNVLYTHTDSVIVTEEGYNYAVAAELIDPTITGKLKIEAELTEGTVINAPGNYLIGAKVAHGGVPNNVTALGIGTLYPMTELGRFAQTIRRKYSLDSMPA